MTRRLLPLLLACALVPAACGGGDDKEAAPGPTSPPATTPAPATTPPAPAAKDLLTGLTATTAPVVGLKVDNAPTARPFHRGLGQAAIVYNELVEGGATRFIAIYNGAPDVEVGPIRSVRESDLELLRNYGPFALGFSGGNDGVLASVRTAVRAGQLLDVSFDAYPSAYRLAERRVDARNFFARPSTLAGLKPNAAKPRDIGLRFGAAVPGGVPRTAVRVVYSNRYAVTVKWNAAKKVYNLIQGTAIAGAQPDNVIIQRVPIRSSRYVDKNGVTSPYTESVGSGSATILRDGAQYTARWSRASAAAPTRFVSAGKDVTLKPGRTWVLLVPTSGSVTPVA